MDANAKAARKKTVSHAIMMVVLIAVFLLFIFPLILVVVNVFKTKADITSNPLALSGAHGFTLENFPKAMGKVNFLVVFKN